MTFCTALNCMDGRIQLPVIAYLQDWFKVEFVDTITEPGMNLILAKQDNTVLIQSILARLKISIEDHHSVGVAIVGHHDCAGNRAPKDEQIVHIQDALRYIRPQYDKIKILGLWVDQNWEVCEIV